MNWSAVETRAAAVTATLHGVMAVAASSRQPEPSPRAAEAETLLTIAIDYRGYRKLVPAKRFGRRAIMRFEREFGTNDMRLVPALLFLAGIYLDLGDYDEAESHCLRASGILSAASDDSVRQNPSPLSREATQGLAKVVDAFACPSAAEWTRQFGHVTVH